MKKHMPSKRTGIALTIVIPSLVFCWHLATLVNRPAHFDEIVSQLGSPTVGRFLTTMTDHSGTRLVFMQGTENGYGLFLYKIGEGKRKLVDEDQYTNVGCPHQTLLGWSPDDKFFAFSKYNDHWEIVICDGDTGAAVATVPVNVRVIAGAWLSPQTLAFANSNYVPFIIKHSQGRWSNPVPFKYFRNSSHELPVEPMGFFTAFDTNSVVWKQGNAIWRCGEDSDAPVKIWDSKTIKLIQFSYSQAANRFLFHGQDTNGPFLADFYPDRTNELTIILRVNPSEYHPGYLNLINDGKGYTTMSQIGTTNMMVTKLDDSHAPIQFRWPDQFSRFVPSQHEIFVTSSTNHGPTGIWKYDVASGSVECVVPRTDNMYYLTNATVEWHQITNTSGDTLTYYLYVPPHQSTPKKHPLIMGIPGIAPVGFAWYTLYQAFADCGCYFMYVERYQRDESQWGQDVLTVYESLSKNPEIDTNEVYLYGVSAGAGSMSGLLREKPKLWRGIIFYSPALLPDPSQLSGKKIFVDCGANDSAITNGVLNPARFQDEASIAGVPVTLLVHPGEAHILATPSSQRERLRETLDFLNEP